MRYLPVVVAVHGTGRAIVLAVALLCRDDGLQVLALPALLAAIAIDIVDRLLRLVDRRLLD